MAIMLWEMALLGNTLVVCRPFCVSHAVLAGLADSVGSGRRPKSVWTESGPTSRRSRDLQSGAYSGLHPDRNSLESLRSGPSSGPALPTNLHRLENCSGPT